MSAFSFLGIGSRVPAHFCKKKDLTRVQDKLGYKFKNLELLGEALSHRSYTQTASNAPFQSYERLEFLGDSVLGMCIAEALFKKYSRKGEGDLTKTKANLVNVHTLSRISKEITLNKYVRLSDEEERAGGRDRMSIMADCLEAVIGAIFLDGGIRATRRFIKQHFLKNMEAIVNDQALRNYKGELLEFIQAKSVLSPHYEVLKTEGPDHQKKFTVAVLLAKKKLGTGRGLNKKEAEQQAAKKALAKIASMKKENKSLFPEVEEK
jgi:ribonuclease III